MEKTGYRKEYKLRTVGLKGTAFEVSFPAEVVERQARESGIKVAEFLEKYRAVAYYDAFEGVLYKFEPVPVKETVENNKEE